MRGPGWIFPHKGTKPAAPKPATQSGHRFTLQLDDRELAVEVRRNAQARRIILRLDPSGTLARVTIPRGVAFVEAERFVAEKAGWLEARLCDHAGPRPFIFGGLILLGGEEMVIRERTSGTGLVEIAEGELRIKARPEHLSRRLTDWLRAEARRRIEPLVREKARAAGLQAGRISIRDTRSRWGSCAANGNLSFSWRLVMAPAHVLDYVVAHEVAHLKHHNHGGLFHALNDRLALDASGAKAWLHTYGAQLHTYGKS